MKQKRKSKQAVYDHSPAAFFIKWLFGLILGVFFQGISYGQGVPRIGNQLEFAGVTIHLTEATQYLIQQEAEQLYVNRALVTNRLERLNLYVPILKPLLAQHALPDDFLFLALYDPSSVAEQPSSGFWALGNTKPAGLRIDPFVDERLHPVRSTMVVINRLKHLHHQNSNWVSVIHRYSQWLRSDTLQALQRESGSSKLYALNSTNDEFLVKLLAYKVVLERAMSVYVPPKQMLLFRYEETKGKSLEQIADACQIPKTGLFQYNTWLKSPRVPENEDYTVYIPTTPEQYARLKQSTRSSETNASTIQDAGFPVLQKSTEASGKRGGVFYRINGKKGIQAQLFDNRITLAYQGKVKVKKFEQYNDLRSDRPIVAGEIYYLQKKRKRANVPFHVVKRGQSLWAIAQQYGIKLRKLIAYNDVNPEQQPAVARILWLQRKRPATTPIEFYRSPKQPDQPPLSPQTEPTLAVSGPETNPLKTGTANLSEERPATVEKKPANPPNRKALATLDSMIAALNEPELPPFRSGATKMIQPVSLKPKSVSEKRIEEEPEEASGPLVLHIAEKTDTYVTVARKYRVTVEQLYIWNNLSALKPLRPGQPLLIDQSKTPTTKGLLPPETKPAPSIVTNKAPVSKPAVASPTVKPSAVKPASATTTVSKPFVVNPSITKPQIASKPAPVKPPVANPPVVPPTYGDELIHVVRAGENLYRIGLRYHVKPAQIQQWNNLPDLTAVVGARLIIRKK